VVWMWMWGHSIHGKVLGSWPCVSFFSLIQDLFDCRREFLYISKRWKDGQYWYFQSLFSCYW
jgi:hypothetical protein